MKNLILVLAMILFSSCVTARELKSTPSLRNEELLSWPHYPHIHPKPHWVPRARKASPPLPAGRFHPVPFHPPPEVTKCLSDIHEAGTCLADIYRAFFTRKAAIGSDCCAAIGKMDENCEKTIFGSFHNPFFTSYVKLHCSNKAVSSPASAPSRAVSSPAAAPSRAVSSAAAAPSLAVSSPAAAPSRAVSSPAAAPSLAVSSPAAAPSLAVSSPAAPPSRAVSSPAAAPSRAVSSPAAAPFLAVSSPA